MVEYRSFILGAEKATVHPCAKKLASEKGDDGWAKYIVTYQHVIVTATGRCKVCEETLEGMLADGATISKSEDQSKANNPKKGLDTKTG